MSPAMDLLPLTEAFYYILITLCAGPTHGYGMMQEIEKMSSGRVRIGAGTLYTALSTLVNKGLIEMVPDGADARRKTYAITPEGKRVAAAEMARLEELLANGRRYLQLEKE